MRRQDFQIVFYRTTGPTKHDTKHPLVTRIRLCANEGSRLFQVTWPNSTKLAPELSRKKSKLSHPSLRWVTCKKSLDAMNSIIFFKMKVTFIKLWIIKDILTIIKNNLQNNVNVNKIGHWSFLDVEDLIFLRL